MSTVQALPAGARHGTLAAIAPGVALATALTAWDYSSKPLWRDELYTLDTARRSFPGMVAVVRHSPDVALVGYYALVHLWLLLGTSSWWLRLPDAAATVVAVGVVALLGRRVGGTAVGVVAGLLAAALPAVVVHAQEARPYPLVLAATALTVLAMLRYRERPDRGRAWTLALVAAAPGCLHPIVGLPAVVGVFAATLLLPGRASRAGVVLTSSLAAVGGGTLVVLGARVAAQGGAAPPVSLDRLAHLPPSLVGAGWVGVAVWLAAVAGAVALHRMRARTQAGPLPVLLGALVAPFAVVGGMGLAGSFFEPRYVSAATVPLALLAAAGLVRAAASLPRPGSAAVPVVATVAVLVALVVPAAVLRQVPYYEDDPRAAARSLARQLRPGDAVVFDGVTARGLTERYVPVGTSLPDTLLARGPLVSHSISGVDVPAAAQRGLLATHDRVWVVSSAHDGAWNDLARVRRLTAGRTEVEQQDDGGWRVGLWGAAVR